MGFLDRLWGRQPDPTTHWPPPDGSLPELVPEEKRFGPLRFGDPLTSARTLGKPHRTSLIAKGHTALFYKAGFRIEFGKEGFCYLALILADPDGEAEMSISPEARPQIGCQTRAAIENRFGTPHKVDTDEEETILIYHLSGCRMEFELRPSGSLKRWNLSPV
jgi:hypothetical protein